MKPHAGIISHNTFFFPLKAKWSIHTTDKINEELAYLFHGYKTILAFISSSYKLTSLLSSGALGNALLLRVVRTQIRIKKAWEMKVGWTTGSIKNDLPTYEVICASYETLKRMSLKLNVLFSFVYSSKWVFIKSFRWEHWERVGRRNKQIIPTKLQVRALIRVRFQEHVQERKKEMSCSHHAKCF